MPLVFPKLAVVSLRDQVIASLKDAFFSGSLQPGDPIVERELAKQLGVATPTVREALIALTEQGFVRRVANTATYVTQFSPSEVRDLYRLRVEFEVLAFQWAKRNITPTKIVELRKMVDALVAAGHSGDRRRFLEADIEFHAACWELSGNKYLVENLRRLMMPLFTFVVLASGRPLTAAMALEHHGFVDALERLPEPEFTARVRELLGGLANRWIDAMGCEDGVG